MRTFPTNSRHAAGRIVAMALLADGHFSKAELDPLDRLDVARHLGLARSELHAVVHGCCEDLLASASGGRADVCRIDSATQFGLLAEITDPALRRQVLQLYSCVVDADNPLGDGESTLLLAAVEHWELQHEVLQSPPTGALKAASHA